MNRPSFNRKQFFLHIVLPALMAVGLFVILIFGFIVPYFEHHLLNGKKELIRELVNSAVSMAERYEKDAVEGLLTREEARERAIRRISHLRYGIDNKDYFWITDTQPVMISHPYRSDLNGKDLSSFTDPTGKKLFVVSVDSVRDHGEGYVDYQWQWMDDSSVIVPKISFVKIFRPWNWIIGTGVYIEDIRSEISGIRQKLVFTLLGISLIITVLLVYIARQSLRTEIRRFEAEQLLKESREKYRSLVEASTDGAFMMLDGKCVYSNPAIRTMTGLSQGDPVSGDLHELIDPGLGQDAERIARWANSESLYLNLETRLVTPDERVFDAVLNLSKISLPSQKGLIAMVKDVSSEPAFHTAPVRENWLNLSESFGIGFFRSNPGRRGQFTDANETTIRLLGFKNREELLRHTILDLITDPADRKRFMRTLDRDNCVINYPARITAYDGTVRVLSVTAMVYRDLERRAVHAEGIIRDISEDSEAGSRRDDLISSLRQPHDLWNQPVHTVMREAASCSYLINISQAAAYLASRQTDVALVTAASGECIGIVTDSLFRDVLSRRFLNPEQPVFEIMRAPVISIDIESSLTEAMSLMTQHQTSHLAVRDRAGNLTGMITANDLAGLLFLSLRTVRDIIPDGTPVAGIRRAHERVRKLVMLMAKNRARISDITSLYSGFADRVTEEIISLLIREMGEPPAPFALIALGSEGRSEQTLMTDQDNALIYLPVDQDSSGFISNYFLKFGSRLNRLLDETGYHLCKGGIMAGNEKWCQPLPVWKDYFSNWIHIPEPQAILDISTFFDLRCVSGNREIVRELKESIYETLTGHPAFYSHLAMACMNYKIPIGLFNKIQTDTDAGIESGINIKSPIRVIVHMIRLYAMSRKTEDANTLSRMKQLLDENVFTPAIYKEWRDVYEFLMGLQLRQQAHSAEANLPLSPYISLQDLSGIETDTLISAFNRITLFQSALSRDFSIPK